MDKLDVETTTKVATALGAGGIIGSIWAYITGRRKSRIDSLQNELHLIQETIDSWKKEANEWKKRAEYWEQKANEWKNIALGLQDKVLELEEIVKKNG